MILLCFLFYVATWETIKRVINEKTTIEQIIVTISVKRFRYSFMFERQGMRAYVCVCVHSFSSSSLLNTRKKKITKENGKAEVFFLFDYYKKFIVEKEKSHACGYS